jgi:hypothetical protein
VVQIAPPLDEFKPPSAEAEGLFPHDAQIPFCFANTFAFNFILRAGVPRSRYTNSFGNFRRKDHNNFLLCEFIEHLLLFRQENTIKTPKHGQRQNYLPVFIPLMRAAEKVADTPDEIRHLLVGLDGH